MVTSNTRAPRAEVMAYGGNSPALLALRQAAAHPGERCGLRAATVVETAKNVCEGAVALVVPDLPVVPILRIISHVRVRLVTMITPEAPSLPAVSAE